VRRGDVFSVTTPRGTRGHEQRGSRYAVVLQADELLILSTVVIAPTSTRANPTTFRPEVTIRGRPTRVLVEQLGAVAPERLGRAAGHLSPLELAAVDDALAVVLGLG
jgi:mRNA interferase MazF